MCRRPTREKQCDPRELRRFIRRPRIPIPFNSKHGTSGICSVSLTCLAIATQNATMPLPLNLDAAFMSSATSVAAAMSSIVAAATGVAIIDQAPKQTVVMMHPLRVIPPHRDAFRRTAFSVYYLSARICWNATKKHCAFTFTNDAQSTSGQNVNIIDWIWSIAAFWYAITYFIPHGRDIDWANGNTYIFVIPMAIGLTTDALYQCPILQCHGSACWNEDVIAQSDLLWVSLSGLVVAFVFTLAFRGVLGIRSCYWSAAFVVHCIVLYLIYKALPFAMLQMNESIRSEDINSDCLV